MTPDSDRLLELLAEKREKFLTFVRWRSPAKPAARRGPEDILQAAFVGAQRRWADFERSGMELEAWFYRIVLNALFDDHDFQTRKRRDCGAELAWPDRSSQQFALGLRNADSSPSAQLGRQELKDRIERVLAALPADQQQIMVLIHHGELTAERAAELLGIGGGTARQRHARARLRFRDVWKTTYGDGEFG